MTMTMTQVGSLKARLGLAPGRAVNNQIKHVLARRAEEERERERERERRAELRRAYIRERRRLRKLKYTTPEDYAARISATLFDERFFMQGAPFAPMGKLYAAVAGILRFFRVPWMGIASRGRTPHLLNAKVAVFTLLRGLGLSYYRIAVLTGRDGDAGSSQVQRLVRKYGPAIPRDKGYFLDAITCVKHISKEELAPFLAKRGRPKMIF